MTEHQVFLVWLSVPAKWVAHCTDCDGKVVSGKPADYEVARRRARDHVEGKLVKKPAKKVAAKKAA